MSTPLTDSTASPDGPDGPDLCSARRCHRPATWALLWNNPRLHTAERRKTWLACPEHRESLSAFLAARTFLKDVVPHPAPDPGRDAVPRVAPTPP